MTSNAGAADLAKSPIGFERKNRVGDDTEAIKKILNNPLTDISEQILLRKDLFKITDDNMAVEYRNKIRYFFNPEMSWEKMSKRLF